MSRRARLAAALLLALLASPAAAFHRTETGTPGRCLWWGTTRVTYKLNASPAQAQLAKGCGTPSPDAALVLARQSFATWASAAFAGQPPCTDFAFVDGGTSTSIVQGFDPNGTNENLVVWRVGVCGTAQSPGIAPAGDPCHATPGACADQFNCWEHSPQTIALTTTSYKPDTGEILDADMELFERDPQQGTGYWFTCASSGPVCGAQSVAPTTSCISMDLGSTVTHEAGHMLGLAHPCRNPSDCLEAAQTTMFGTAALGDTQKRTLKDDDVQGVCTIYPAGGAPQPAGGVGDSGTACAPLPSASKSGCGCGNVGAGVLALLGALAALARLRLRRRAPHTTIAPA
jgi:hypothetical protein